MLIILCPVQPLVFHPSNAPGATNHCSFQSKNMKPAFPLFRLRPTVSAYLDAGPLHTPALFRPLPTIGQPTSQSCTPVHPRTARLAFDTGSSSQSGLQEVGSPFCGPVPDL
ncbi:unnamed protein product [Merluccius merluccius]